MLMHRLWIRFFRHLFRDLGVGWGSHETYDYDFQWIRKKKTIPAREKQS